MRRHAADRYPERVFYAAYGSNLHPLRLERRGIRSRFVGTAHLESHALHFHKRGADTSGKCNIRDPGDGVYLAVYELSETDKRQLDVIEGVGRGYHSEQISLARFGDCHVYVAEHRYVVERLEPFDWYLEMVLAGCRWLGFPDDYVARIAAVTTVADPDVARRKQNWETVDVLRRNGRDHGAAVPGPRQVRDTETLEAASKSGLASKHPP